MLYTFITLSKLVCLFLFQCMYDAQWNEKKQIYDPPKHKAKPNGSFKYLEVIQLQF